MEQNLSSECAACSSDAPYTGVAERRDGRIYGIFACPQCRERFAVWRPEFATLISLDLYAPASRIRNLALRLCLLTGEDAGPLQSAVEESGVEALLGVDVEVAPGPPSRAVVDLKLGRQGPPFRSLEGAFGPASSLPRTGPFASYVYQWTVCARAALSEVSLFARFRRAAEPDSLPFGVLLRLDRPSPERC